MKNITRFRMLILLILSSLNIYAENDNSSIKRHFGFIPGDVFEFHNSESLNVDILPSNHPANLLVNYRAPVLSEELMKYFHDFSINVFAKSDKITRIFSTRTYPSMDACKSHELKIFELLKSTFPTKEVGNMLSSQDEDCDCPVPIPDADFYSLTLDGEISMSLICTQDNSGLPFSMLDLNIVHIETQKQVDDSYNSMFENFSIEDFANKTLKEGTP